MKKVVSFVLFTIIITSFSFARDTTPAPTSTPTMQGDLLWTREIYVYDSQDPDTLPLADVEVTATALETVTIVTDGEGRCEISVLAHDTALATSTTQSRKARHVFNLQTVTYLSGFRLTPVLHGRKSWNYTKIFAYSSTGSVRITANKEGYNTFVEDY